MGDHSNEIRPFHRHMCSALFVFPQNFLINIKFEVILEYNQHTRVCYVSRGLSCVQRGIRH